MQTHSNQTQENKSQAAAKRFSGQRRGDESGFHFIDNRPDGYGARYFISVQRAGTRALGGGLVLEESWGNFRAESGRIKGYALTAMNLKTCNQPSSRVIF